MFDDEPVDPMKEAMKQYYRDNPHIAARHTVLAMQLFAAIFIFSLIVGAIIKALGI
jgi:hypothetical protein